MKKENYSFEIVRFLLKKFHVNVNKDKEHLLIQIFNFFIVGVIATIIDFVFLYIFRDVCKFHLIISNTLSFIISFIYNYYASITFVFDVDKNKNKTYLLIIFVLFSLVGLILNNTFLWLFTNIVGIYYMLSKAIATIFTMVFNFITRKKFME